MKCRGEARKTEGVRRRGEGQEGQEGQRKQRNERWRGADFSQFSLDHVRMAVKPSPGSAVSNLKRPSDRV